LRPRAARVPHPPAPILEGARVQRDGERRVPRADRRAGQPPGRRCGPGPSGAGPDRDRGGGQRHRPRHRPRAARRGEDRTPSPAGGRGRVSPDSPWIVWAVVAPLIAALLAAGFGPRATPLVFLTGVLGVPVSAAALAVQVERFGPPRHAIGGWGEPLGIELYADGLAALMLLVSAVVGAAVSVYASGFFGAGQAPPVPVMATDGSSVGYGHAPPVAVAGYPGGAAPAPPRAPHGVLAPGMPDASGAGQALTASPPADARAGRFFWPLWMLLWAALNALFLSRDV